MSYSKYGTIREERPDLVALLVNTDEADKYRIGSLQGLRHFERIKYYSELL